MQFSELGLSAELLRAIGEQGYTTPTPVQQQAIPHILAGRDLEALAQTGTGKTAAFVLPILQRLTNPLASPLQKVTHTAPRVLVLVPTRELAAQVLESVRVYGAHTGLRSLAVFGGVGINPQIQTMRRGIDILVATPGRLLDHLGQRTVDLSKVQTLVLDEADRMFDMGFIRDIRRIIEKLPKVRQNLMFSATFAAEVRELAHTVLKDPAMVEVARRNAPAELVTHTVIKVDQDKKRDLLASITKPMTATAVMVLSDLGELKLSDHVVKFIPEFADGPRKDITIEHLLTHTSGLPDQLPENKELRQRHAPLTDFVQGAVRTPVVAWSYML